MLIIFSIVLQVHFYFQQNKIVFFVKKKTENLIRFAPQSQDFMEPPLSNYSSS